MTPDRPRLLHDDRDYVVIYAFTIAWTILYGTFPPSTLGGAVWVHVVVALLMSVAGASGALCLFGVVTRDNAGPERIGLLGVMFGFGAFASTQLLLAPVYLAAHNTDRVAFAVFAWLPFLFANRRRRLLNRERRTMSAVAKLHERTGR